jgi:hypothetical protein
MARRDPRLDVDMAEQRSRALAPLGIRRVMSFCGTEDAPEEVGYGTDHPTFWLAREARVSGPLHVAFAAPDRAAVDAFHGAGLDAGGRDNGVPGLRGSGRSIIRATTPLS